jgi:transcriptional regulator with XRE-family HTH domain
MKEGETVMQKGKTIKQIADEIGVTKQAVHQKRKGKELSTALQPFTTTVDGVVYISVDGEKLIKSAFVSEHTVNVPTTVDGSAYTHVDALIAILKEELEGNRAELAAKNQQIAELNARLADTTSALLAAQQTAHDAQALHAGTMRKQLATGEDLHEEITPRRGLLARLFNKNKEG